MAKRKRSVNYDVKIKKGYGQGEGVEYKPWLSIQDVPSSGRVTRLKGIKIPRQFELMSDLERDYFYILEFSEDVIDIREQFAILPIESTLEIAAELGIQHSTHVKTKEYVPVTTDFFLTVIVNDEIHYLARTVKPSDELLDKRVLEKFEIERVYWERKNIDWGIVTEKEINKVLAQNIASFREYRSLEFIAGFQEISQQVIGDMCNYFAGIVLERLQSIREIAMNLEKLFYLKPGCGLSLFNYLLANKIIKIPLLQAIDVEKVYIDVEVNDTRLLRMMTG